MANTLIFNNVFSQYNCEAFRSRFYYTDSFLKKRDRVRDSCVVYFRDTDHDAIATMYNRASNVRKAYAWELLQALVDHTARDTREIMCHALATIVIAESVNFTQQDINSLKGVYHAGNFFQRIFNTSLFRLQIKTRSTRPKRPTYYY